MTQNYPKYDKIRPCPKCGNDIVTHHWHEEIASCVTKLSFTGDHIHRICGECGFEWAEEPLGLDRKYPEHYLPRKPSGLRDR